MKMKRLSGNYSWPLRLTGYGLFLLIGVVLPFTAPLIIWALVQTEINRHKTIYMMRMNDWAVYNPDRARSLGIEPNYTAAFNVGGIAGAYLNITSYNSEPLLEEYCRKGNKITRSEMPNLTDDELTFLLRKINKFNSWDTMGCFVPIVLIILVALLTYFVLPVGFWGNGYWYLPESK
jgi:hypothetical protein